MFIYKKLGKFTYNILKNHKDIKPFLLKWLGAEWNHDHKEYPEQLWTKEWLEQLPNLKFKLKIVNIDEIRPRKELMNYKTKSYCFMDELKERAKDREESMQRGVSIEPLVVRGSDMELMDGYTRYIVIKKFGEKKVYAYVGS